MSKLPALKVSRRAFVAGSTAVLALPALAQTDNTTEIEGDISTVVRRNISSFRSLNWEPYFSNLSNGAILVDTTSRALHFWSEDQSVYKLYPTSVPLTEDLTRRGRTSIIRKVEGPSWSPTPAMKVRNPEWPEFVGPGPNNPLGTHALYLSWQYYRIHGTHDTRKIGRRSSNGCIGLYNEHIAELYSLTKVGTQVLLI
ncbi:MULTISPECIES: L,D-transpeptidase [Roseobacteraceae]|jgi:lipoprotein-anchoring transpeptidase ErfK/SrfK|uniref:ErfK/YbiS/YcfS/YnhG family protein n=1 Tax=Celeribacter baekdonensis B30 TaxID=1208323 RepID=K2IVR0_9RHOB|nr:MULTISPECIES: L,D-transpeptidase [Roseobacteraceae]MBU0644370.1 L,D-transpeptidase [Alphaproteobacteria bacterium]EKE74506.1 ErfK/YbiS/YcfS/YnhG family protein [Celeribacter baekdonensis B30]KAB6716568.1 L,D-transpeptidase [Roseobacter sp. TSBP12]MBU1277632.1 L,D-transpeptidase [Alphaproteobacteria bacterium]MBU1572130.1 L,D-transpeptidase [Alphaproteobacteria bacterium]|tara:strand:- start:12750 stop:13343 length:594 start_codon:yes stop_codon:yes gene_type:complete